MTQKKRSSGLGRGLGSLLGIPEDSEQPVEEVSRETAAQQAETAEKLEKKTAAKRKKTSTKPTSEQAKTDISAEPADVPDVRDEVPASVNVVEKKKDISRPSDMFFQGGAPRGRKKSDMSELMSARTSGLRAPRRDVKPESSVDEAVDVTAPDFSEVSRETSETDMAEGRFTKISVAEVVPNRKQPRKEFDQDELDELTESIREVGVLQPIVVRPLDDGTSAKYELVMGERRWRATQAAGLEEIPAIVRVTPDVNLLRDALLENLHRSQLNPLEEAAAYQDLLNEYGCTQEELSQRIGRSRPRISNTMRLMNLPALVQRRVAAGILSAGHARALLSLPDAASMEKLAQRIVNEGLSVRAVEELVASAEAPRDVSRETKRREPVRHERLDYFANALSDRLDTNVKISLGAKKGRMSIEFASVDDLNRIMDLIAPDTKAD
ncbi:ParB/RepB/Spo0J family partition protein [Micrococcoides hystricis]|uniref:ParB/RepB/Spo0J family partition protein n=1 Tax=Micrococcoides hystricis TaxID=1572761 RepID=A0ABV6PBJ1_9MICC